MIRAGYGEASPKPLRGEGGGSEDSGIHGFGDSKIRFVIRRFEDQRFAISD
jgi:hypothetical protein